MEMEIPSHSFNFCSSRDQVRRYGFNDIILLIYNDLLLSTLYRAMC